MDIILKEIPDYPDYLAGSDGKIRSKKYKKEGDSMKVLLSHVGSDGYHRIAMMKCLKAETRILHRIVCMAFHGMPKEGEVAIHIDGDFDNNAPSNLRWSTKRSWRKNDPSASDEAKIQAEDRSKKRSLELKNKPKHAWGWKVIDGKNKWAKLN